MPAKFAPITARPNAGGRLMTCPSSENVGVYNYITKRNFRRFQDQEIPAEGHDYFWPNTVSPYNLTPGTQPFPLALGDSGPVNLIHEAGLESGYKCIIVGTPTRLYRFFALEDAEVYESDPAIDPYAPTYLPAATVYDDTFSAWLCIGSGFSASAQRWEAVNIKGYTILNNGVDLPVTYRIGDAEVTPIYELREQGYAAFGTIAEYKGILMLGDVTEIQSDKFEEWFDSQGITRGGDILASQAAGIVTLTSPAVTPGFVFTADDIGKTIVYETSPSVVIVAPFIDGHSVNVAPAQTVSPGERFTLRVTAAQTGSTYSGATVTAGIGAGTNVAAITGGGVYFTAAMVLKTLRFANGWSSRITALIGVAPTNSCQLVDNAPETITALPFWTVSTPPVTTDFTVTASAPVFTVAMIGLYIAWADGTMRRIEGVLGPGPVLFSQVKVDSDLTIASSLIYIENPNSYAAYTLSHTNRYQYRLAWSMNDEPRRFAANFPGDIAAGSNILTLKYPIKSLSVGDEIIIAGAGVAGGNLTATILYIAAYQILTLQDFADTTVTEATVQRSDASGSIAGYQDLLEDTSGILRMLDLDDTLVIYKDRSIVLARDTGNATYPFAFRYRKVSKGKTLYYRYTLVLIASSYHVFAGRNSIYRFDLNVQEPVEIIDAELCKNIFFDRATLANRNSIFAADNGLTKEVFFCFATTGNDTALVFDHLNTTFRTTDAAIGAAATVSRPLGSNSIGETEQWFVMAIGNAIVVYGLADETVASWAAKAIYYRRHANPWSATKLGYESKIRSGLSDFGSPFNEKWLRSYVLHLASATQTGTMLVTLYGARNPAETPDTLFTETRTDFEQENLIPTHYLQHCFGDEIVIPATVAGAQYIGGRAKIAARTFEVSGVDSRSFVRRPA